MPFCRYHWTESKFIYCILSLYGTKWVHKMLISRVTGCNVYYMCAILCFIDLYDMEQFERCLELMRSGFCVPCSLFLTIWCGRNSDHLASSSVSPCCVSDLFDWLPTGSTANCCSDLSSAAEAGPPLSSSVVLAVWKRRINYGFILRSWFDICLRGLVWHSGAKPFLLHSWQCCRHGWASVKWDSH